MNLLIKCLFDDSTRHYISEITYKYCNGITAYKISMLQGSYNIVYLIENLIIPIFSILFCLLALFVLVYYIRRRYKLYKEINRIPQELLILEAYKNHLKNLKLKCIIHNFIIYILIMEIIRNLGDTIHFLPDWFILFAKGNVAIYQFASNIQYYSSLFTAPVRYSFIPALSMLMHFLWLAYRKYEYKYTIIRWTWYVFIRILVQVIIVYTAIDLKSFYSVTVPILCQFFIIFDFFQFVYYSKKFYLYLKSREKEIRLFYYDGRAYLEIRYLRIHFKIATILVALALFFYTIAVCDDIIYYIIFIFQIISFPVNYASLYPIADDFAIYICNPSGDISKIIFILNYLYIFIVVVYKSYRDGQKLKNINNYIKPIVDRYHETYYNRYTNYA